MNKIDEAINIVLGALALGFAITTIISVILYMIHPLPSLEATMMLTGAFACSLAFAALIQYLCYSEDRR